IQYAKDQTLVKGHIVVLTPLNEHSTNWSDGIALRVLSTKTNKLYLVYQCDWQFPNWDIQWLGARHREKIIISNNSINSISNGTFIVTNHYNSNLSFKMILNRIGRVRVV
ncbi:MAG: pilus assembly protein, partial [bacterium]|nr:pilus assembly protein [bacterium]